MEEENEVLPKEADIFGIQEALFKTGFRLIGDVDHLDPGVRGCYEGEKGKEERRRVIARQLEMMSVPGEWEVHWAIADAVIKRNDAINDARAPVEDWGMDQIMGMEMDDPMDMEVADVIQVGGIEAHLWDEPKLVKLRIGLYRSCRKYRKAKAKFDRAVNYCIAMEDLKHCHEKMLPWSNILNVLRETWNTKAGEEPTWQGVQSPVKKPFVGKYAAKMEVAYFVYTLYIRSIFCMVGAIG